MVAALILIGNTVTSDRIEAMEKADQLQMLNEVLPTQFYDNDLLADQLQLSLTARNTTSINNSETSDSISANDPIAPAALVEPSPLQSTDLTSIYVAKLEGKVSGLALPVTAAGYGGDIDMIMGVDNTGTILGVRVIGHKETPGLGDKIEFAKDPWITAFNGLSLSNTPPQAWAVKKDGGQFDQFTGATITPRAIVKSVHQGLIQIHGLAQSIDGAIADASQPKAALAMSTRPIATNPSNPNSNSKPKNGNSTEVAETDE